MGLFFHSTIRANTYHCDSTQTSFLKYEAGFDMLFFVNTFRGIYSPGTTPVFSLTFIRHIKHEIELRLITGFGKVNSIVKTDTLTPSHYNETNMSIRLGFEKEIPCNKRWMFFYGTDLFAGKDIIQTIQAGVSETFTDNQNNINYGIAPDAGIKFFITPRIILSTEMDFDVSLYQNTDNSTYRVKSKDNSSILKHGFTTSFITPNNIFILIKF